ncbi:MAG: hypothetical protein IPP77_06625 [Bacteroidetes bacterium]|nr:hypothetical protein [Bacteroidota bacterium]
MTHRISTEALARLSSIRHQYGTEFQSLKKKLLQRIKPSHLHRTDEIGQFYHDLQFLMAYPDDKEIFTLAKNALNQLVQTIEEDENRQYQLGNSGLNGTTMCAAFGFEVCRWLQARFPHLVSLNSIDADEGQISAVLSVVLPKVESEILQDENDDWKSWLQKMTPEGGNMLDTLLRVFDQADMRPEVRDELWNSLLIYTNTRLSLPVGLPDTLYQPFYHRSLVRKAELKDHAQEKPKLLHLRADEAQQIIDCSRMVLLRHIREIDPITFTQPDLVSYYQLSRGLTVALFGMAPARRHPIDNYMGYVAFKNGMPIAYAGSWLLFDSGRIGLNVFPAYRGGESQYLFGQILELHRQVYQLKRFSVDPYQIGKHNKDGIDSGAFWLYHSLGFEPIKSQQKMLAQEENAKRIAHPKYRSPAPVLKKLADSRMELLLEGKPAKFDATDLSIVYARLIKDQYNGDRKAADEQCFERLIKLLHLKKAYQDKNLAFVLKNWAVLLMANEKALRADKALQRSLRQMFEWKASGSEEDYLRMMRKEKVLRKWLEEMAM